jgi:hypothetical protein
VIDDDKSVSDSDDEGSVDEAVSSSSLVRAS